MLPTSLAVVLATVAMTLVPALLLLWAWRRGLFRDLDAQSRVIFEPRDGRVARPWESPAERRARVAAFGAPEAPGPGEWGGSEGRSEDGASR
ncbi:MAG: hypothetical protein ACXW05_18795, partial [Gemmatirosa sp.]